MQSSLVNSLNFVTFEIIAIKKIYKEIKFNSSLFYIYTNLYLIYILLLIIQLYTSNF